MSRLRLELTIVQHLMLFRRWRQSTAMEPESLFVESIRLIRPTHSQPPIGVAAGICCLCHPCEPVDTQLLISFVVSAVEFGNHKFLPGSPWCPDLQLTFGDLPVVENHTLNKLLMLLRVVFFYHEQDLSDWTVWRSRSQTVIIPRGLDPASCILTGSKRVLKTFLPFGTLSI